MPYAIRQFAQSPRPLQASILRCDGISNFRSVIRKLWADHVFWTRQYIVSTLAGLPDRTVALRRLLANQDSTGQAIISFLGPDNGLRLARLLREHVQIAIRVVAAIQANDQQKAASEQKAWSANAVAIATLLNKTNPRWPKETLVKMLQHYLDLTVQQVIARTANNWPNDVAAFDASLDHMMKFADFMANGMLAVVVAATARRKT